MCRSQLFIWIVLILMSCTPVAAQSEPAIELFEWERGIAFRVPDHPEATMYLWFYEWTMFGAVREGQHTRGFYGRPAEVEPVKAVSADLALIKTPNFLLRAQPVSKGVELSLTATNESTVDWPELAAIIPCFNPGPEDGRNLNFADEEHQKTLFLGSNGLERLEAREIHFNSKLRNLLLDVSPHLEFVWKEKWPTSPQDARAGVLIRESRDDQWVAAIAWENFLSVQGHNPWKCMHHSIHVGPLPGGSSRHVRGKVYLFRGNAMDALKIYQEQFQR